jgi:beta-galactosidase
MGAVARETASLDGEWQIVFDHKNVGRVAGWYRQQTFEALAGKSTIQVPNCWETIEQDYEGVGWYGRRFRVPASWSDQVVRVQFGAVNYRAEVWINDQPAGFHEGGYTPFVLTIGDLLKPGEENFIVVRVIGPILTRNVVLDGIGPNEMPHWRGAIAGGIWQTVGLIATNPEFVADVFVEPDIQASRAVVHAAVVNSRPRSATATLELAVTGTASAVRQEIALRPGTNDLKFEVPIPGARLWTPDSPHLYTLAVRLRVSEQVADAVEQRFGMREFAIHGDSYYLNGKKIYIKAGFWEGFYPQTLAFPPNADVVRREIRLAKEAGFNVLRPWRKPPVPMILNLADEMGIMLIGAPPIECMDYWPQLAPETEQRIAIEIREMLLRDRNHPSVIYWELFNEIARHGLSRLKHNMSLLARELDPTRMVIDESGGWAEGAHAYPPYSYEPQAINEIHSYKRAPVESQTYDFYLHLAQPGFDVGPVGRSQMKAPDGLMFVSEVGYGGLPDLPANVEQYKREGNPLTPDYRYSVALLESIQKAAREMKWNEIFPDTAALCRASQRVQAVGNRLQLEALRLNPRMAGYCLHAYTDGDWVIGAGVLDLFRNPKLTYETVKRVQAPLYLAIQVNPPNFSVGQSAKIRFQAVNEQDTRHGQLQWEIVAPDGGTVHRGQSQVSIAAGIGTLLETNAPPLGASGTYKVRVRFAGYENEHEFFFLADKDLQAPATEFAVFDPRREITPFLQTRGMHFREFRGAENLPVIVATDTSRNAETLRRFTLLMDYVKRGGTAVFLKTPGVRIGMWAGAKNTDNTLVSSGVFPFQTRLRAARGNWDPVNHGVRPHPIFEGLPAQDFMGQAYLNVCASETIEGIHEPPIVGSLSFDFGARSEDRNYLGPKDAWWGSDMVVVPYGSGRMLLSTLRITENLGKDPVADKLFYNMVRWAGSKK